MTLMFDPQKYQHIQLANHPHQEVMAKVNDGMYENRRQ